MGEANMKRSVGLDGPPTDATTVGRDWLITHLNAHNRWVNDASSVIRCRENQAEKDLRKQKRAEERWKPTIDERLRKKKQTKMINKMVRESRPRVVTKQSEEM